MKKYRVVQIGGKFYPEKRYLFVFWNRLTERVGNYPAPFPSIDVVRYSLSEAEDFIQQQILKDRFKKIEKDNIKIHAFNERPNTPID